MNEALKTNTSTKILTGFCETKFDEIQERG